MNQKGFANIILIVLVVVLAGVAGYFALTKNSTPTEQTITPQPPAQNSTPQASAPTPVAPTATAPTADSPRIITCNPRGYDSEYFKREKPCFSDMTAIDIERENKALAIIKKAIAAKSSLQYTYGSLPQLFVSDKRYQVIQVNIAPLTGNVVIDIVGEKVTDYFVPFGFVENSVKRFVFLDRLPSQGSTNGNFIRQYTFGKEKSTTLSATEVYYPQTYYYYDGPMGSTGVKVLSSTTNSVTLGIYDRNKPLPQKPGDDFVQFEQVGTKVINLAD